MSQVKLGSAESTAGGGGGGAGVTREAELGCIFLASPVTGELSPLNQWEQLRHHRPAGSHQSVKG